MLAYCQTISSTYSSYAKQSALKRRSQIWRVSLLVCRLKKCAFSPSSKSSCEKREERLTLLQKPAFLWTLDVSLVHLVSKKSQGFVALPTFVGCSVKAYGQKKRKTWFCYYFSSHDHATLLYVITVINFNLLPVEGGTTP